VIGMAATFPKSDIAVVVVAYNRPESLRRLFRSLETASRNVLPCPPLIVSVDGGGTHREACVALARSVIWPAAKHIIEHDTQRGLRNHILACGDLTKYCEAVILLEDDLCVAPACLSFAEDALRKYRDDPRIAGISLYSFIYNEFCAAAFMPVDDGWDTYFVQTASSWGQVLTRIQWTAFRDWLNSRKGEETIPVPNAVRSWPQTSSWKRAFNLYLADVGRYFVFPRFSFSTNMGDQGIHLGRDYTHLTAPLSIGRRKLSCGQLETSLSRYDPFLEIEADALKAAAPWLATYDFDVDLTGAKPLEMLRKPLVLTCRTSPWPSIRSFGFRHFPAELNIIFEEPGEEFGLRKRDALSADPDRRIVDRARSFFINRTSDNDTP
jgi:hypothetical protein